MPRTPTRYPKKSYAKTPRATYPEKPVGPVAQPTQLEIAIGIGIAIDFDTE